MFASETKKEVRFGDSFITIRKLSGYQLALAREEAGRKTVAQLRDLGGELISTMQNARAMNEAAENLKKKTEAEPADVRYAGYDRMTTLKQGIVTWSAGDVTDEKLRDLEEDVAEKTFREIIDLTIPPKKVAEAIEEKG